MLNLSEPSASRFVASAEDPAVQGTEVSGVLLRVLADVAMRYDVSPAQLFGGDAERFSASEPLALRISLDEYRAVVARAIALTGDAALGLRCGLSASDAAFDLFAPLVAYVPSLRHAIGEASQFSALIFEGGSIQLDEAPGVARLSWELPWIDEPTDRFTSELAAAGIVRMLRSFGAVGGDLRAIRFRHKRPAQHRTYAEVFQGKERFSAELFGVELAAHLLDRPHLHANPSLQKLVHAQAEQRLAQLARPTTLVSRLHALLGRQPLAHLPDMTSAARQLGVSVRSLRRRLREEGTSYRALTQGMQRDRACAMLRNPELTLKVIADAVGFSDLVAFHHAFRRWTGSTPCEYRAHRRAASGGA